MNGVDPGCLPFFSHRRITLYIADVVLCGGIFHLCWANKQYVVFRHSVGDIFHMLSNYKYPPPRAPHQQGAWDRALLHQEERHPPVLHALLRRAGAGQQRPPGHGCGGAGCEEGGEDRRGWWVYLFYEKSFISFFFILTPAHRVPPPTRAMIFACYPNYDG